MPDRISLTHENFMKMHNRPEDWVLGCSEKLKQQILHDHEFRNNYQSELGHSEACSTALNSILKEENKQLKEKLDDALNQIGFMDKQIERISDKLGNKLQVKVLEIEELKQKLDKIVNLQTIDLRLMIASSAGDKRLVEIFNKIGKILEENK